MAEPYHDRVERFLQDMIDCFSRGRFREFTARIAIPMVVYSEGQRILVATNAEEAALLLAAGWLDVSSQAHRFEPRLVSVGCTVNGEFPVRVDWLYLDAAGRQRKVSRVRYIMGESEDGGLRIHLTEVFGPTWVRPIDMPVDRFT